jgi:Uri superfamily endonuclease
MFQTPADCHIDHLTTTTASAAAATTTTTTTEAETAGSVLNQRATMILLVASADLDCNIICIR